MIQLPQPPFDLPAMWRDVWSKAYNIAVEVSRTFLVDHITAHHHPTESVSFVLGSMSSPLTTAERLVVPIARSYRVLGRSIVADASGSCVVDVRKATPASSFPASGDIATGNSICATAKPTLASQRAVWLDPDNPAASVPGWTVDIEAGSVLQFVVESTSTVKQVTVFLELQRMGSG